MSIYYQAINRSGSSSEYFGEIKPQVCLVSR